MSRPSLDQKQREKWHDRGLAALFVAGLWLLLAVFFDFYYDLNDDVAMKDILSGTYTGVPDGHNIQMLYPLGWCISVLYKMLPMLPWYGIFLCSCQFLAVWLCFCALLPRLSAHGRKRSWLLLFTLGAGSLLLYEWIFIQYTVTAGLLAAAALVRLLTAAPMKGKAFFCYHSITGILIVLAFYLRTEMLLLLSPFLGIAGLWQISRECMADPVEPKKNVWRRYCLLAAGVLSGMSIGLFADNMAYGSPDWRAFRQFFDDRTSVYDFYGIPDHEIHKGFYEQLGMSEAEYTLLQNYNFELDEEIDTAVMQQIAAYAAAHQEQSVLRRIYLSAYTYVYRFLHGQELIFDLLLAVSYFFLIRLALREKKPWLFGRLVLLFGTRTVLWLFLLYRGRVPERITHPLYLMELLMLLLLFSDTNDATRVLQWKKYEKSAILSMYILLFACTGFYHVQTVSDQYAVREETNRQWQQWKSYAKEHPQQFYYLDVYSTVAYSEKLFSDISPQYRNFDLLGGWCSKSPLAAQKRAAMGLESAQDGLLSGKAFFVTDATKPERTPEFLISWYREKGKEIALQKLDECGSFSIFCVVSGTSAD